MAAWSEELVSKFEEYAWCVDPESDRDPDAEAFLYWNRLSSAPKTMGDVVESVLGAVFVDSEFSLETIHQVLDTIIFKPWWERFKGVISPEGISIQHPASELSKFLDTSKCTQLLARYFIFF
jgi:dsRNA-specific ribonuclease